MTRTITEACLTRLIGHFRTVLLYLDGALGQRRTSEEMRVAIVATIGLFGKVARAHDMTALHQKMDVIHVPLSQTQLEQQMRCRTSRKSSGA